MKPSNNLTNENLYFNILIFLIGCYPLVLHWFDWLLSILWPLVVHWLVIVTGCYPFLSIDWLLLLTVIYRCCIFELSANYAQRFLAISRCVKNVQRQQLMVNYYNRVREIRKTSNFLVGQHFAHGGRERRCWYFRGDSCKEQCEQNRLSAHTQNCLARYAALSAKFSGWTTDLLKTWLALFCREYQNGENFDIEVFTRKAAWRRDGAHHWNRLPRSHIRNKRHVV